MKFLKYHNPLYGHFHQIGIIVSESHHDGSIHYLTSIPKFGGDYITLRQNDPCVVLQEHLTKEELLVTLSKFGFWWFWKHKDLYQYLLVHEIFSK